jgi:hypothetical protein
MGGAQFGLNLYGWLPHDLTWYSPASFHKTYLNRGVGLVRTIDFGITLGAQKKISDRFFITLTAFHSLINLVPNREFSDNTLKNTNVMIGFSRYRIVPKEN